MAASTGSSHTASASASVLAGAASGVTGTCIGFPFDSVKTRLQASGDASSPRHVLARTIQTEGIRGLYRGVTPPLISLTLLNSIVFSTHHNFARPLVGLSPGDVDFRVAIAGSLCCIPASAVSTPFEVLKVQASVSNSKFGKSEGSLSVLKRLGVNPRTLYAGWAVNSVREALFLGAYFGCFENARIDLESNSVPPSAAVPIAGGLSGAVSCARMQRLIDLHHSTLWSD